MTNEDQKPIKKNSRDYSKFIFDGKEYNKGRLVHAVIEHYVYKNRKITYADLKQNFPAKLQGSFGIFETFDNAKTRTENSKQKRYYIEDGEKIELSDETITTSREWNLNNIKDFIKQAHSLGLKITRKV